MNNEFVSIIETDGKYYQELNERYQIQDFLKEVFKESSCQDPDIISISDITIDTMLELIKGYKGLPIHEGSPYYSKWIEILIAAVYLYWLTYEEENPYSSLFYTRERFVKHLAKVRNFGSSEFESLCQTIESAAGFNGPLKLKPMPDSPGEMFCLALWLVKNNKNIESSKK